MKHLFLLILLVSTTFVSHSQWTLIWSDEFGGSALDNTKWISETGGWGWGNNELQYYTDGDNLTVSGGVLVIEARAEQFTSNSYTSGKIITKDLFEIKYGKIETRMKMPLGQGLWPAFWMLGANISEVSWPYCGEIDIMEHINNEMATHGTAHWHNGGHVYNGNSTAVNPTNYHIYSIEWNANEIRWFMDGNQYFYLSIQNNAQSTDEMHLPFYLILNLAVGGNWPGYPNASTPFPAQVEIDYVRAYKLDAEASATELTHTELNVFPNPAKDQLNIVSEEAGSIQITSLNGAIILEEKINSGTTALSVSTLDEGMYFCSIVYADGRVAKTKFTKTL